MRNFQFRSAQLPQLDFQPEVKVKPKKWTSDRVILYLVLGVVLIWVLVRLHNALLVVRADGQIVMNKVNINFTEDIRLLDLYVESGQEVCLGDTLFRYRDDYGDGGGNYAARLVSREESLRKERERAYHQYQIAALEARQLKAELDLQHQAEALRTKKLLLDAITRPQFEAAAQQIRGLEADWERAKAERSLYYGEYKRLKDATAADQVVGLGGDFTSEDLADAPLDGIIGPIHFNENEVCYEGEHVLTLYDPARLYVRAFFEEDDASWIEPGARADVIFPDGTKSEGVIDRTYIGTEAMPDEFQKKYLPTTRSLVVDIRPASAQDEEIWRTGHLMSVDIRFTLY